MGQSVSRSSLEIFGMVEEDANAFRLAAHEGKCLVCVRINTECSMQIYFFKSC